LEYKNKVIVASDGQAFQLLCKEFPDLTFFEIKSPRINYLSQNMWINAIAQLPKAIQHYYIDNEAAKNIVNKTGADVIISDNRFGFFDRRCKNIYITHQINIMAGFPIASYLANSLHHSIIKKFDECWVPDYEDENKKIAGLLSTPKKIPNFPIKYIGPLTRIMSQSQPKDIDILMVLSGPEPQRTILEKKLVAIDFGSHTVMMVRGTSDNPTAKLIFEYQNVVDSLTINALLNRTKTLITRSGYSTLMDIDAMDIKAILIPTPGQYEQEYLANYSSHIHPEKYSVCLQSEIDQNLLDIIMKSNNKA
jgi:hypothetical protein